VHNALFLSPALRSPASGRQCTVALYLPRRRLLGCLDWPEEARPVVQRLLELQPGLTIGIAILSGPQHVNPSLLGRP
jgi:hypothetical protein